MTDRPILFSAPMVRALLDGRKTQTRRIMKVQPPRQEDFPHSVMGINRKVADGVKLFSLNDYERQPKHPTKWDLDGSVGVFRDAGFPMVYDARFAVGDRLWVKETHACVGDADRWTLYRASGYEAECDRHGFEKPYPAESEIKWKPSIFMRRGLSRLTLTVTDVRVERLHQCSEADALAEGIDRIHYPELGDWGWPQRKYAELWNSINGAGAWEANPWVVAVSFDVRKGNIDA
ncbi:hypothetical protein [Sphingobium agri]|uniref:Morphogenetic protein n=1 Tax=Sphingobium agri TaxID=2933566 RepID=A0ABT0E235_9SPHN|nr:hypothetical protein [Sphingobium agri]MCK0533428.1 hypothetical protein [Sphingobium agri]